MRPCASLSCARQVGSEHAEARSADVPALAPMAYRPVPGAQVHHCARCGIAAACRHDLAQRGWLCLRKCSTSTTIDNKETP